MHVLLLFEPSQYFDLSGSEPNFTSYKDGRKVQFATQMSGSPKSQSEIAAHDDALS